MILKNLNSRYLRSLSGKLLKTANPPVIELEIYGSKWIPNNHPTIGHLQFYSKGANTAYIDFGDGSPIGLRTITSLGWINWNYNDADAHVYPRIDYWKIKIWFEKPELITNFYARYINLVNKFPSQIGLYPIKDIYMINLIRFNEFPDDIAPGYFNSITFNDITVNNTTSIPKWIYLSRLIDLNITKFDLTDKQTNNLDKLILCKDLTILRMSVLIGNNSFPDNFKDFPTLTTLVLGNSNITEIPTQVNANKKLTSLIIGYGGGFPIINGTMTNWGVGVANMPNLKELSVVGCPYLTTDFPTGMETSGVKRFYTYGSYATVARVNEHILKAYNKITSIATMDNSNSTLREATWNIGSNINTVQSAAPSGSYQAPVGYIQGVSNGTPANPLEMIYVIVKQYRWTVRVPTVGVGSGAYIDYTP